MSPAGGPAHAEREITLAHEQRTISCVRHLTGRVVLSVLLPRCSSSWVRWARSPKTTGSHRIKPQRPDSRPRHPDNRLPHKDNKPRRRDNRLLHRGNRLRRPDSRPHNPDLPRRPLGPQVAPRWEPAAAHQRERHIRPRPRVIPEFIAAPRPTPQPLGVPARAPRLRVIAAPRLTAQLPDAPVPPPEVQPADTRARPQAAGPRTQPEPRPRPTRIGRAWPKGPQAVDTPTAFSAGLRREEASRPS